jgi:hypothetical protein
MHVPARADIARGCRPCIDPRRHQLWRARIPEHDDHREVSEGAPTLSFRKPPLIGVGSGPVSATEAASPKRPRVRSWRRPRSPGSSRRRRCQARARPRGRPRRRCGARGGAGIPHPRASASAADRRPSRRGATRPRRRSRGDGTVRSASRRCADPRAFARRTEVGAPPPTHLFQRRDAPGVVGRT